MVWPFRKNRVNTSTTRESIFLLALSTPNFDKMISFLSEIRLEVRIDERDQLCPCFNNQRCASIWQSNNLIINIEENTSLLPSTGMNILLESDEYTEDTLKNICQILGQGERIESLYGTSYSFVTPDGGSVLIGVFESDT